MLTYVSQFNHLHLIKLCTNNKLKIQADEPVHPIGVAAMKNYPESKEISEHLINTIQDYCDYTPLSMAAGFGYHKLFNRFIAEYPEQINAIDQAGFTPLMRAAQLGRIPFVFKLLECGADIDLTGRNGQTFFHILPQETDFIRDFNEHYAQYSQWYDPTLIDKDGFLPIHHAIAHHHTDWVINSLDNHPGLLTVKDNKGRGLAVHAIMAGDIQLLRFLDSICPDSLTSDDEKTLLTWSIEFNQIDILSWLDYKKLVNLGQDPVAVLYAISTGNQLDWCLGHPTFNGNIKVVPRYKEINWAMALVASNHYDYITRYDLFRRFPNLCFERDDYNNTVIDEFVNQYESDEHKDDSDALAKAENFARYVLDYIKEPGIIEQLRFTSLQNFKGFIQFCLQRHLIDVNEKLEGQPLFHLWEEHFFAASIAFIEEAQKKGFHINDEAKFRSNALKYYSQNIKHFIGKYPLVNVNAKDSGELHLVAKLFKLPDSTDRIQWLKNNTKGLSLKNLDDRNSSLLHLAAQSQDFSMLRWCIEKLNFSPLETRSDGLNSLDLSLLTTNDLISQYLIKHITKTNKLKKIYLDHLKEINPKIQNEVRSRLENIGFNHTNLNLLTQDAVAVAKTDNTTKTNLHKPSIHETLSVSSATDKDTQNSKMDSFQPEESSTDPLIKITNESLLDAIKHSLPQLKKFKHPIYQEQLKTLLASMDILAIFSASDFRYAVMYQLLRFTAVIELMTAQNWKELLTTIIKEGQDEVLLLLLNHPTLSGFLGEIGPELLISTLSINQHTSTATVAFNPNTTVNMLLGKSEIAATADLDLVLLAIEHLLTPSVYLLLNCPNIQLNAHEQNNILLKNAAATKNMEACEILLSLDNVLNSLKAADCTDLKQIQSQGFDQLNDLLSELMPHAPTEQQDSHQQVSTMAPSTSSKNTKHWQTHPVSKARTPSQQHQIRGSRHQKSFAGTSANHSQLFSSIPTAPTLTIPASSPHAGSESLLGLPMAYSPASIFAPMTYSTSFMPSSDPYSQPYPAAPVAYLPQYQSDISSFSPTPISHTQPFSPAPIPYSQSFELAHHEDPFPNNFVMSPHVYLPAYEQFNTFYDSSDYVQLNNRYDFYHAILISEYDRESDEIIRLYMTCEGFLEPQFVFNLCSFAVSHNKLGALITLFKLSTNLLNSHPKVCNKLTTDAIRMGYGAMADYLLHLDVVQQSASLFNNRLLRRTIDYKMISQATGLMQLPSVQANLDQVKYYSRCKEFTTMIESMLRIPSVLKFAIRQKTRESDQESLYNQAIVSYTTQLLNLLKRKTSADELNAIDRALLNELAVYNNTRELVKVFFDRLSQVSSQGTSANLGMFSKSYRLVEVDDTKKEEEEEAADESSSLKMPATLPNSNLGFGV